MTDRSPLRSVQERIQDTMARGDNNRGNTGNRPRVDQAADVLDDLDVRGGDAFGATEDPSPALQTMVAADLAAEEDSDIKENSPETGVLQSKNGTLTFTPSKTLSKDELRQLRGE